MKFFNGLITGGLISIAFWVLILGIALAQEVSPQVRALNLRAGTEIQANIQCNASLFEFHDKLTALQAEIKRLTDK